MKECDGQMTIFQFLALEEEKEKQYWKYWDPDINQMVALFEGWAAGRFGKDIKHNFHVWSHVEHLGYRLTLDTHIPKEQATRENIMMLSDEMNDYSGIDISLAVTNSFKHKKHVHITVFTLFTDERRHRR